MQTLPLPDGDALPDGEQAAWWIWLPLSVLAGGAAVLAQVAARPVLSEAAYRREPEDSERFKAAVESSCGLLPGNPRDVVRTVNLMRLEYLVLDAEADATRAAGKTGTTGPHLNEWECVTYTLLQQRYPAVFDPVSMAEVLAQLGNGAAGTPEHIYGNLAARLENGAVSPSIASDIQVLGEGGRSVQHLVDKAKLQRFLDVNHYVLDIGARLRSDDKAAVRTS